MKTVTDYSPLNKIHEYLSVCLFAYIKQADRQMMEKGKASLKLACPLINGEEIDGVKKSPLAT